MQQYIKLNHVLIIFIKMIINEIVKKKNLNFLLDKQEFDKLIDSTLKLVMMQPRVNETVNTCFKCLDCLPCYHKTPQNKRLSSPEFLLPYETDKHPASENPNR